MDWFGAIMAHMPDAEARQFVVTLVLILVIDRRLHGIMKSNEKLTTTVVHAVAHQTARMQEIRDALYNMAGWEIPKSPTRKPRVQGGQDGTPSNVP